MRWIRKQQNSKINIEMQVRTVKYWDRRVLFYLAKMFTEDLDMIKTENPGILEAIREVRIMGLGRSLRAVYEMKMKEIRDQKARDAYVLDEGIAIGEERGMTHGITLGEKRKLISLVRKKALQNLPNIFCAPILFYVFRLYSLKGKVSVTGRCLFWWKNNDGYSETGHRQT